MNYTKHQIIQLPKILDERGNLSFIESNNHIPFEIKRTYLVYDVPGGDVRGGHAYHTMNEFIVALSGSFDVIVDDGTNSKTYSLNRSYYGLLIPKLTWRSLENFSTNALCMVISSGYYDESNYIRDFETFKRISLEAK